MFTIFAKIKNGRMVAMSKGVFKHVCQKFEGKDITLIIKRRVKKRTTSQNSYYWVVLNIVGADLGYYPDEMHSTFKAMYLTDKSGKLPIVKSTTGLGVLEFMEYLDKIIKKCADLGIVIPSPDEYYQN